MSMGIMGIGAQFINAAGRGGKKKGVDGLLFVCSDADPSIPVISCIGEIVVTSTKNGTQIQEAYSDLSNAQIAIQADANTEIVISGNLTSFITILHYPRITSITRIDPTNCLSLQRLEIPNNNITSLDVSRNTDLTILNLYGCTGIASLDLSANTALTELSCNGSNITYLDISHNTALTELSCGGSNITYLDISHNTALTELECNGCTGITSLDLSANTALTKLSCSSTSITYLDTSHNTALTILNLNGCTGIASLDLSANTALTELSCNGCTGITSLDLSANTALNALYCDQNPNYIEFKYNASNGNPSNSIANAITAATSTTGTVYTDSAAAYYSTIADAATAKGWTIAPLS